MEIRVLGPVEVIHGGRALKLGRPKQQVALALLATAAGRAVSLDELVEELWGDQPVASAVANARGYVGELRRLLGRADGSRAWIVRVGSGYRLDADEVDVASYEAEAAAGRSRRREGRAGEAVELLQRALSRCRGGLCAGLPLGPVLAARAAAIGQDVATLVDELALAHIELGESATAVRLLEQQLRTDPVRERAYELLMRARYDLDGAAGALQVYEAARLTLAEQLGVEPCARLRQLQRKVLDADPSLMPAQGRQVSGRREQAEVPRQLPAAAAGFVGRHTEAQALRGVLTPAGGGVRPAVAVLHGPGGVGKSALALQVAHEIADRFPDGQIYVDLQGYTPGLRPLEPVEALRQLLAALGVPRNTIPHELADAAARFRTVTANRRLLVLADNAVDAAQVKHLIPGSASCGVLITSRRRLGSLDAEVRLALGGLPEAAARRLLARHAGLDAASDAVERIVQLCGGLPLALRIAGARLAGRPDLTAAEFADWLATDRLDALEHDDLAVRGCIRSGYDALPDGSDSLSGRAFRALGVLRVPDVTAEVVAALLNQHDLGPVRAALEQLVDAQLLEPAAKGRYRLHDLVRLVATELAEQHDSAEDREQALHRAALYYGSALHDSGVILRPGRTRLFAPTTAPNAPWLEELTSAEQARAWIDAESGCLVAIADQLCSATGKLRELFLDLSESLWDMLFHRCQWQAGYRLGELVLASGQSQNYRPLVALGNLHLGRSRADLGDYVVAERYLHNALAGMRECHNHEGEAVTHVALGVVAQYSGRPAHALLEYEQALGVAQRHGLTFVDGVCYHNMSASLIILGRLVEAIEAARKGQLATQRADAPNNLAAALCMQGCFEEAIAIAEEAIAFCAARDDHHSGRAAQIIRAEIALRRGDGVLAAHSIEQALRAIRSSGDTYLEPEALRQQAKLLASSGQWEDARRVREQADAAHMRATCRPDRVTNALLDQTEPNWANQSVPISIPATLPGADGGSMSSVRASSYSE